MVRFPQHTPHICANTLQMNVLSSYSNNPKREELMATTGTAIIAEPRMSRRDYVRTTIVLPAALDQNLEIFCAKETKTKTRP